MASIKVTPEELRTLGKKCTTEASAVATVRTNIDAQIKATNWESSAATKFKSDWASKYVKALNELESALQQLGTAATTMASNYDAADQAYKGN